MASRVRASVILAVAISGVIAGFSWPVAAAPEARQGVARPCVVSGFVRNGELALPGASVSVRSGDRIVGRTSTDVDGAYAVALAPGSYTLRVELSVFAPAERPITIGDPP